MDDADNGDRGTASFNIGTPAASLVVRAWLEPGPDGLILRGTVCRLGGRMLGAFDSLERLFALIEADVASKSE